MNNDQVNTNYSASAQYTSHLFKYLGYGLFTKHRICCIPLNDLTIANYCKFILLLDSIS